MADILVLERVQSRMNQILKECQINKKTLADLAGLPKASISQYCGGKNVPSSENAKKIRDAVNKKFGLTYEVSWIQGVSSASADNRDKQDILLRYFNQLTPAQQDGLINMAKILCNMNNK